MDLRNWETFVLTGGPVVGAAVEVREATLTHPNAGAVVASGTTNSDGMWSFTGLPDGPKDVKVTYLGKIKWYKGMTRHSVSLAIGENFTPADENLLKNGGFELWRLTPITLGVAEGGASRGWLGKLGAGDTGVVSQESGAGNIRPDSRYSLKLVYVKSAGPAYIHQPLPDDLAYGLRGRAVTLSITVKQGVASSAKAFINDGVETLGAAIATVGAFVTLTVTRTIQATAVAVDVGLRVDLSDTLYVDNAMLVIGSVAGVYTPRRSGNEAGQVDYTMLDRAFTRQFLYGG